MSEKLKSELIEKIKAFENPTDVRKWIREKFNVKKTRANEIFSQTLDLMFPDPVEIIEPVQVAEAEVGTVEELAAANKIDLNVWEVTSFRITNWDGKTGVRGEFRRKVEEKKVENLLELFQKRAQEFSPKQWNLEPAEKGDYMFVLGANDLHLAKLAWDKESGQNYDIEIAKRVYKEAIKDLISKVQHYKVEKVVLIAGSDFFQTDDKQSRTTNFTYVDSDSRWTKAFSEGCELMTDVIEELSQKYNVSVVQISGNHDHTTSYYLGAYLKAWFRHNPRVVVNDSPTSRKYEEFGNTLVGFSHGDMAKLKTLPLLTLKENLSRISQFKYIEHLTGHLHSEQVIEDQGVKIRTLPSLCAPDAWHVEKGYNNNIQTCQGLLYSRNHGLEAIFYSKPVE